MNQPLLIATAVSGAALATWGLLGWPVDSVRGLIIEAAGCLICVAAVQRLTS